MKRRIVLALVTVPVGLLIARVAATQAETSATSGSWWLWMTVTVLGCLVATWSVVDLGERWLLARRVRRGTVERLRGENAELRAENAVLHDEVQSLDVELAAAREGRIGGVA